MLEAVTLINSAFLKVIIPENETHRAFVNA
jgi:hypothetical protein